MQRISRSDSAEPRQAGFALLEIICVLAVTGFLAAIVLPAFPRHTSRARLQAYAAETAAILKTDRLEARRRNVPVDTMASAPMRQVRSGTGSRVVQFPRDVAVDTLLAANCGGEGSAIRFYPSGRSCGGTVSLAIPGARYDIRVNWLTGGVEIVAASPV